MSTHARAPATNEIPSLNGFRALAILVVFLGHATLTHWIGGVAGVTIFFFLSGYLITTLLRIEGDQHSRISLRSFYLRRVLRIMPPFYLVLGVGAVITATGFLAGHMKPLAVLSEAAYFINYYIIADGRAGLVAGTNQLWSLAVEEHFYLLFPFAYIGLRRWLPDTRKQAWVLLGLCAAIGLWRCGLVYSGHAGASNYDRAYLATDTRIDSLLFGCAFALGWNPVLDGIGSPGARNWRIGAAVSAFGFFLITMAGGAKFGYGLRYSLQGLLLMPVFVSAIADPLWWPWRVFNWRPIRQLGVFSYTMYLTHRMVLFAFQQHTSLSKWVQAPAALIVVLAISAVLWVAIEKPSAALRRRLSRASVFAAEVAAGQPAIPRPRSAPRRSRNESSIF